MRAAWVAWDTPRRGPGHPSPALQSCLWAPALPKFLPTYICPLVLQQATETAEEEDDQPLSLSWPSNTRKQVTFLIVLPIVLPLWITLPDVRKPVSEALLRQLPCQKYGSHCGPFPVVFNSELTHACLFSYLLKLQSQWLFSDYQM